MKEDIAGPKEEWKIQRGSVIHASLGLTALALLLSGLWHLISGVDSYDRMPGFLAFFAMSMACLILRHHLSWLERPVVSVVFGGIMAGAALDLAFWHTMYARVGAAAIGLLILPLLLYWARRTEPERDQKREVPEKAAGVGGLFWIIGAAIWLIPKALIDTIRRAPSND